MRFLFLSMTSTLTLAVAMSAMAQDNEVDLLRQQIEAQQQQLEAMQQRLDDLQQQTQEAQQAAQEATERTVPEAVVTSGEDRVQLNISGQVNRMVNIADDGDQTKAYFVDNNFSSTRLAIEGEAQVTDELVIGALFEGQMESNSSTSVSQEDEDTGTANFTDRDADIFIQHDRFGEIRLGQGSTASDGTSQVDLSGTAVIAQSEISDLAGGLLFVDDGERSDVDISDIWDNLDGLSRQDRLLYETPEFAGFTLSADAISDQRWSTALRWGGDFGGLQAAAAIAYSNPNEDQNDWQVNGSASALHEPTGLNFTIAGGQQDGQNAKFVFVKPGWKANFFEIGSTNFSLDYSRAVNFNDPSAEGDSVGGYVVQQLADLGIDFYTGVRWHSAEADGNDFDDIWVYTFGSRVKF